MFEAFQDLSEQLDYSLNWAPWLQDGETIASSVWVVPAGATLVDDSNTTTTATAWIKLTVKRDTSIVNKITTNSTPARKAERSISIKFRDK